MICNIKVTNILVDGGMGLNILSPIVFKKMQVPPGGLRPTKPFSGITSGVTMPVGLVSLMVTIGTKDNYRTKSVAFDITEFDLPYNGILGRPVLAKFMAVAHYMYLTVKIPGLAGPISIPTDLKGPVSYAERLYQAATAADDGNGDRPEYSPLPPRKIRLSIDDAVPVKEILLREDPSRTVKISS